MKDLDAEKEMQEKRPISGASHSKLPDNATVFRPMSDPSNAELREDEDDLLPLSHSETRKPTDVLTALSGFSQRPHTERSLLSAIEGLGHNDASKECVLQASSRATSSRKLLSRPVTMRSLRKHFSSYEPKTQNDISDKASFLEYKSRPCTSRSALSDMEKSSLSALKTRPISSRDLSFMEKYISLSRNDKDEDKDHSAYMRSSRPVTVRSQASISQSVSRPNTTYSSTSKHIIIAKPGTSVQENIVEMKKADETAKENNKEERKDDKVTPEKIQIENKTKKLKLQEIETSKQTKKMPFSFDTKGYEKSERISIQERKKSDKMEKDESKVVQQFTEKVEKRKKSLEGIKTNESIRVSPNYEEKVRKLENKVKRKKMKKQKQKEISMSLNSKTEKEALLEKKRNQLVLKSRAYAAVTRKNRAKQRLKRENQRKRKLREEGSHIHFSAAVAAAAAIGQGITVDDNGNFHAPNDNGGKQRMREAISLQRAFKDAVIGGRIKYALPGEIVTAAGRGNLLAIMKLLFAEKPAMVDERDMRCRTALIQAAKSGHERVVRFLLFRGADLGAKDCELNNALHLAAKSGHTAVVNIIINYLSQLHPKSLKISKCCEVLQAKNNFNQNPAAVSSTLNIKRKLKDFMLVIKMLEGSESERDEEDGQQAKGMKSTIQTDEKPRENFAFQFSKDGAKAMTTVFIPFNDTASAAINSDENIDDYDNFDEEGNVLVRSRNQNGNSDLSSFKRAHKKPRYNPFTESKKGLLLHLLHNAKISERRRQKRIMVCKSEEERERVARKFAIERDLTNQEIVRITRELQKGKDKLFLNDISPPPLRGDFNTKLGKNQRSKRLRKNKVLPPKLKVKVDNANKESSSIYDAYIERLENISTNNSEYLEQNKRSDGINEVNDVENKETKNRKVHFASEKNTDIQAAELAAEEFRREQEAERSRKQTFEEWNRIQMEERKMFFEVYNAKKVEMTSEEDQYKRALEKAKAVKEWRARMKKAKHDASAFRIRELKRKEIRDNRIHKAERKLAASEKVLAKAEEPLKILREMELNAFKRFQRKKRVSNELKAAGRTARTLLRARKVQRESEAKWRNCRSSLESAKKYHAECLQIVQRCVQGVKDAKKELPRHLQRGRLLGPGAFSTPSDTLDTWRERFTALEENPERIWMLGYYNKQTPDGTRLQDPRDYISNVASILPRGQKKTMELRARQIQESKWAARIASVQRRVDIAQANVNFRKKAIQEKIREKSQVVSNAGKTAIEAELQREREDLSLLQDILKNEFAALDREKKDVASELDHINMYNDGIFYQPKVAKPAPNIRYKQSKTVARGTSDVYRAIETDDPHLAVSQSRLKFQAGPAIASMTEFHPILDLPGPHSFLELSLRTHIPPHPIPPGEEYMNFHRWKPKQDKDALKKLLDLFTCARKGLYDEVISLQASPGWPHSIHAKDASGNQLLHGADLDARGYHGNCALHCACAMGFREISVWLRSKGVSIMSTAINFHEDSMKLTIYNTSQTGIYEY
eukprot:g3261.t1